MQVGELFQIMSIIYGYLKIRNKTKNHGRKYVHWFSGHNKEQKERYMIQE